VVLPQRGLTGFGMGSFQAIQPLLGKERIRPALMIAPTAPSLPAPALAEEAAKPHPNPAVQVGERGPVAVFEIFEPAPECGGEADDDRLQALPRSPFRLGSDRVLEFLHALGSRVASPPLEPIAQKVIQTLSISGIHLFPLRKSSYL